MVLDIRTANRIKKLWLSDDYRASFSGSSTFYQALKEDNKIKDVTYNDVQEVLRTIPTYQQHDRGRKNYDTRHVNFFPKSENASFVGGSQINYMADIGVMPKAPNGERYFLAIADLNTGFIYCHALKSKSPKPVLSAILSVKSQAPKFVSLGTDEGSEFTVRLK